MSNLWQNAVSRLRAGLVENWPIKLTALVLAGILWAAVAAQEPTTQLVPVRLTVTPPAGRSVTGGLPEEVQALYSGTARELIKLYARRPAIHKTLPDSITGSTFTLDLSIADLAAVEGAAVKPQQIEPRSIVVQLDDVIRRSVPIAARVQIIPDSGFRIFGGVAITPAQLTIHGSQEQVEAIDTVFTVPLALRGVRGPVRRQVPIDTVPLAGVRFGSRAEVTLTADVGELGDRVIEGVPVVLETEIHGAWTVDPAIVTVTVHGRRRRLSGLTRDSVGVTAYVAGEPAEARVPLRVATPQGIAVLRITPDSVTVRRENLD
jgi:YbbR domain-containing protein